MCLDSYLLHKVVFAVYVQWCLCTAQPTLFLALLLHLYHRYQAAESFPGMEIKDGKSFPCWRTISQVGGKNPRAELGKHLPPPCLYGRSSQPILKTKVLLFAAGASALKDSGGKEIHLAGNIQIMPRDIQLIFGWERTDSTYKRSG